MDALKHRKWKIILFLLYGVLLGLWLWLEIPCIPRLLTGLICPGCGMSRAWLSLLQLDLKAAFFYHPMFWSVPVLALYIWRDGRLFRNRLLNNWVLGVLLSGFAACYIIRLIVYLGGSLTI